MALCRLNQRFWTYGVEHELADWDTRLGWEGYGRDPEPNILNSNGIAGDPTLRDYPFGAEINTPPTATPAEQGELLGKFIRGRVVFISHQVGMHVHIRVPGLRECLPVLKRIQQYVSENLGVYPLVNPIPLPAELDYDLVEDYKGARKWALEVRRGHWMAVPAHRVRQQLKSLTVEEFFPLEVPFSRNGVPLYHAQRRSGVNLRQLLQTDTIEFRMFFQTIDPLEVITAVEWCRDYLQASLDGYPAVSLYQELYSHRRFPPVPQYEPWRAKRWRATSYSKNNRRQVQANIKQILAGRFDDVSNDAFLHLQ